MTHPPVRDGSAGFVFDSPENREDTEHNQSVIKGFRSLSIDPDSNLANNAGSFLKEISHMLNMEIPLQLVICQNSPQTENSQRNTSVLSNNSEDPHATWGIKMPRGHTICNTTEQLFPIMQLPNLLTDIVFCLKKLTNTGHSHGDIKITNIIQCLAPITQTPNQTQTSPNTTNITNSIPNNPPYLLIDLGSARRLEHKFTKTDPPSEVSAAYLHPLTCSLEPTEHPSALQRDLYALGCLALGLIYPDFELLDEKIDHQTTSKQFAGHELFGMTNIPNSSIANSINNSTEQVQQRINSCNLEQIRHNINKLMQEISTEPATEPATESDHDLHIDSSLNLNPNLNSDLNLDPDLNLQLKTILSEFAFTCFEKSLAQDLNTQKNTQQQAINQAETIYNQLLEQLLDIQTKLDLTKLDLTKNTSTNYDPYKIFAATNTSLPRPKNIWELDLLTSRFEYQQELLEHAQEHDQSVEYAQTHYKPKLEHIFSNNFLEDIHQAKPNLTPSITPYILAQKQHLLKNKLLLTSTGILIISSSTLSYLASVKLTLITSIINILPAAIATTAGAYIAIILASAIAALTIGALIYFVANKYLKYKSKQIVNQNHQPSTCWNKISEVLQRVRSSAEPRINPDPV